MIQSFETATQHHAAAVDALTPLVIEMAVATVADALPGAVVLETRGEMNEDWAFTLRIIRVLDQHDRVLYDIEDSDGQPEVEPVMDAVGLEYLDLLLELTGEDYFGRSVIRSQAPGSS